MTRVLNIVGPGQVRLDRAADPVPGPDDVLVRIEACGICGSDLGYINQGGTSGRVGTADAPMPLGHEAAGTVLHAGPGAAGLSAGMRVLLNPMLADSVIGNGGAEGAFTETLLVRGARLGSTLYPIPAGIPFEVAALAEPLAVSLHGVNRGAARAGEKAVVFGAGPIGLGMILWLKRRGLSHVVSVDLSASRLKRARALGADATIDASSGSVKARLGELHGREATMFGEVVGTDVFFDAAGAPGLLADVLDMAKQDARLVITAVYSQPVPFDLVRFLTREMHITSAMGYPTEFPEVIAILEEDGDAAAGLISHRFAFDDIVAALDTARSRDSGKVMISFPS